MPKLLPLLCTALALSACVSTHAPQDSLQDNLWQSPAPTFAPHTPKAERIAQIALREHKAWGEPFITTNGQIAKYSHYESENARLTDGSRAWERVVAYWRDSGALARLDRALPYERCDKADSGENASTNICRAFVSDVAWSAGFVSYVMRQADVDFYVSPRHFDYIATSWQGVGDYRTADPLVSPLKQGDILCYVRSYGRELIGSYQDLDKYLADNGRGLPAHCDIVVKTDKKNREIWLIGGNVLHTVMLRKMPMDNDGKAILPAPSETECSPNHETACNFNRQNWVVALVLQEWD
ncbi:Uncharacterized protein conserved in bacteria [Moraxella lacunata]|uniref:Uncharacterized protein conserved in bacteria n=1 Tax=Moraxella lacunata TaxID=477 RepID=A0A378TS38_MORLA|nr:DUF2272 domain-containing protein [Moraxella lacunata]STZ63628.1 Uncharacterized protein conserved in bacteria [Moraxella lacunata]